MNFLFNFNYDVHMHIHKTYIIINSHSEIIPHSWIVINNINIIDFPNVDHN